MGRLNARAVLDGSLKEATKRGVTFPNAGGPLTGGLKSQLESELYRWDAFPLSLPPLIGKEGRVDIRAGDLFQVPSWDDELRQIAEDEDGNIKHLSPEQLRQVARNGEFAIQSRAFPNQQHRWRLNKLFQVTSSVSFVCTDSQ